ncbi:MAG: hypothetical protein ACRD3L_02080 [Terriglobales bacterium]
MEAGVSATELRTWKDLYMAALFESDKPRIAERIAEAQLAIVTRKRRLTLSATDVREQHTLDNALFSLEALRLCLSIPPPGVSAGWRSRSVSALEPHT